MQERECKLFLLESSDNDGRACHIKISRIYTWKFSGWHEVLIKHLDTTFPLPLTDQYFWRVIDGAGMAMGFESLFAKIKLPALLMVGVGYVCAAIGWVLGRKLRVNPFTVS